MKSHTQSTAALFSRYAGKEHFASLRAASGGPKETYRDWYLPVAERFAKAVQDLPLRKDVFAHKGGALQFGLSAGLLALRSVDSKIFNSKATSAERQAMEPVYRWLSYCATLSTAYLICASHIRVRRVSGRRTENFSWCGAALLGETEGEFLCEWEDVEGIPEGIGPLWLQSFFFPGQFGHLDSGVLGMFMSAINPKLEAKNGESPMGSLVRESALAVIQRQKKEEAKEIDGPNAAAPLKDMPVIAKNDPGSPPVKEPAVVQQKAAEPEASAGPDITNGIPKDALNLVRAIARSHLKAEVKPAEGGRLFISSAALGFGGSAAENYGIFNNAGLVHEKIPRKGVELKASFTLVWEKIVSECSGAAGNRTKEVAGNER